MTTEQTIDIDTVVSRRSVRLESIDPERNRFRFFVLSRQPTLWDGPVLVRIWVGWGGPAVHGSCPFPAVWRTRLPFAACCASCCTTAITSWTGSDATPAVAHRQSQASSRSTNSATTGA